MATKNKNSNKRKKNEQPLMVNVTKNKLMSFELDDNKIVYKDLYKNINILKYIINGGVKTPVVLGDELFNMILTDKHIIFNVPEAAINMDAIDVEKQQNVIKYNHKRIKLNDFAVLFKLDIPQLLLLNMVKTIDMNLFKRTIGYKDIITNNKMDEAIYNKYDSVRFESSIPLYGDEVQDIRRRYNEYKNEDKTPCNFNEFIMDNVYHDDMLVDSVTEFLRISACSLLCSDKMFIKFIKTEDDIDNLYINDDADKQSIKDAFDNMYNDITNNKNMFAVYNMDKRGNKTLLFITTNPTSGIVIDSNLKKVVEVDDSYESKSGLFVIVDIGNRILQLIEYINKEDNIDTEIKINSHDIHRAYNFNSRKACIVKSHKRHYKSGKVTLVRSYKRGAVNMDNNKAILIVK